MYKPAHTRENKHVG